MRLSHLAAVAAALLLAPACKESTVEPIATNAVAVNDCGPADGPQVTLYYVKGKLPTTIPPDTTHFVVRLPGSRESVGGRLFVLGSGIEFASASRCTATQVCSGAISGTIRVNGVNTTGPIDVTLKLLFVGGEALDVRAIADWRPRTILCG